MEIEDDIIISSICQNWIVFSDHKHIKANNMKNGTDRASVRYIAIFLGVVHCISIQIYSPHL
jgi:hypothetical protein